MLLAELVEVVAVGLRGDGDADAEWVWQQHISAIDTVEYVAHARSEHPAAEGRTRRAGAHAGDGAGPAAGTTARR